MLKDYAILALAVCFGFLFSILYSAFGREYFVFLCVSVFFVYFLQTSPTLLFRYRERTVEKIDCLSVNDCAPKQKVKFVKFNFPK